ncbi:hypothetical protein F5B19DRAFT_366284 [Rostrohypoxylon terebratum]|nr:hypothetical protein F5B19DRAFT_366284 [Rostrohypoxylon terebratum]
MAEVSILRFPISGKESEYFLLEVSSNGSRPLDLKLIGSESTAVFTTKLRHKRVQDYKAQKEPCRDEEWEDILTSTFINQNPIPGVQVRADLSSDGEFITLSFRKNIKDITRLLGTIRLEEDGNTEISPFDWCVSAIGAREKAQEDLAAAIAKTQLVEDSLKELRDQVDDLIKAKEEDEAVLLEKFRDLLNEKKVKIRQQQRLLASVNVDPDKLANVSGGRNKEKRIAQSSRVSKRKIKEEPESSDVELERMDIEEEDDDGGAQPDIVEDRDTTADETASGTSTDDEPAPPPVKSRKTKAQAPRKNARASASASAKAKHETHKSNSSGDDSDELPPRRVLPFMKNKQPAAPAPKPVDDDETESDEEL